MKPRGWLIIAVMGILTTILGSGFAARTLTHRKSPKGPEIPTVLSGLSAEPLRLTATDGIETGAWLYLPPAPKCVVILAHGNGSRRQDLLGFSQVFIENGCAALPITLRAHGDSEGEINDFGYGARLDIQAAVKVAQERLPQAQIYVFGQSLGAAAALFAAPDLGEQVQGYLLESPYASLEIAVKHRLSMYLPQPLVGLGYQLLVMWAGRFLDVPIAEIAPVRAAAKVKTTAKFVVLAGRLDQRATLQEVRTVVDALPEGARLEIFEEAAHSELSVREPGRYLDLIRSLTAGSR